MKSVARIVLVAALAIGTAYMLLTLALWNFGIYTPINGVNKVFASERDLIRDAEINSATDFVIKNNKDEFSIPIKDIASATYSVDDIKYLDYISGAVPNITTKWDFKDEALKDKLSVIYKENKDAKIKFDKKSGTFTLVDEVKGTDFDLDEVSDIVKGCIESDVYTLDIQKYTKEPDVKSADLQKEFDKVSWVNDWSIKYEDGTTINAAYLASFWKKHKLIEDSFDFNPILDKLEHSYNTDNKTLKFKTNSGKEIDVKYVTYGKHVFRDKETEFIKQAIKEHKSYKDRYPETYGFDSNIQDEYIEVSITKQHVWHYKNGKVVSDSPCVTGCVNKGHGTPKGVFYVSEKIPGKNLKGDNYVTWVNRWMRVTNGGVGLHDAYWRGNFGGNIYISNGSHGCINLPKAYAYKLYDEITTGIPVVIY